MQAVWVAARPGRLKVQRHDPGPALTASFSVFPAWNVGDVDAGSETASPLLGLRPVGAGLLLVPKNPNPAIRTSSPLARASPMAANTSATASLAAALLRLIWAASRSAISALFTRSPPPPSYPVPFPITRREWRRSTAAPEETARRGQFRLADRPSRWPAIRPPIRRRR